MEVSEFPCSPFHGESVKFKFAASLEPLDHHLNSKETVGVFHVAFAPNAEPDGDAEPEYSVESLGYFPTALVAAESPLPYMAKSAKFMAGLGDKLDSFSKTRGGGLLLESVVGAGKKADFLTTDVGAVAAAAAAVAAANKLKAAAFLLADFPDAYVELFLTDLLVNLCADNRFKKDTKNERFFETLLVVHPHHEQLAALEKVGLGQPQKVKALAEAVAFTRELVVAPPNFATTVNVANLLRKRLSGLGLRVSVLDADDCRKQQMFSFLAVGQGSKFPPKFVHAVYKPDGPVEKTLVLVGKGIMFDSGGYNLKVGGAHAQSASSLIHFMKNDMGGCAAVFGAALAVAKLRPRKVQVHFVSAMCENMVDANSYRPGDVVRVCNGKTVEVGCAHAQVLNTDAEGRMTLADALVFGAKLEPDYMVDLATLTGAQLIALGRRAQSAGAKCAAFYSTDEDFAALFADAAKSAGERMWRMPLLKEYKECLKSKVADLANVNFTAKAGSVLGALFLREFVGSVGAAHAQTKWIHLDMAGPVVDWKNEKATGYGVTTLVSLVHKLAQ